MSTFEFNTKIGKVENKILYVTDWIKKTDYDAKISKLKENALLLLIVINLRGILFM